VLVVLSVGLSVLSGILSEWAANRPDQLPEPLQPIAEDPWLPLLIVVGAMIVVGVLAFLRDRRGEPQAAMQADIQRLQQATDANLEALSRHAGLVAPEGPVRLPRTTLSAELAAAGGNLVVTGSPGSGKSALLRELAVTLRERTEDVVLLTTEDLPGSAGQARSYLGLQNDLTAALTGWTGSSSGTLILDGLDATLAEEGSGWLQKLVSALGSTRWRVVVSIWQFDLHHSPAWQGVFRGRPVSTAAHRQDPRLANVRHLLVSDLTDGELAALPMQSAQVAGLLDEASPRLRALLRNPFNLFLAAGVLTAGQSRTSLAPFRSQLELLQSYWQHRVDHGGDLQRVRILTRLTGAMIAGRRLQIDAASLFDAAEFSVVEVLLRDGVLREAARRLYASGGRRVLFAHDILFDFAVATLLLGDEEHLTRLAERLDADPSLAVLARPSLDLHLADVWQAEPDHATFWRLGLKLSGPDGHVLAALAAAATAVHEITGPSDLAALANTLAGQGQRSDAAYALVGWIAGTLAVSDDRAKQQAQAALPAYAWLTQHLAQVLEDADDIAHVQTLVGLVWQLEDLVPLRPGDPGTAERATAIAALMQMALADPAAREQLADRAARFLVGAVAVDPGRHGPVLQRTLAPEILAEWGLTAVQHYLDNIATLASVIPPLATMVIAAAQGFQETRDEATFLYRSAILPLTSTRKQDVQHARSEVARRFPELLVSAADVAVRALTDLTEASPAQPEASKPHRYPVVFGTVEGHLRPYSRPLELLGGYRSAPLMVDELAAHLRQLAEQDRPAGPDERPGERLDQDPFDRLLRLLVDDVHHAEVWARLLQAGGNFPHSLGRRLLPLLDTSALLAHPSTRYAAGALIRALGPFLTDREHATLEGRIFAVEAFFDKHDPEQVERAGHARDQLLGCLAPDRLQTEQARARLAALAAGDGPPALLEPMRVESYSREFTFADDLAAQRISEADIPGSLRKALASLYDDVHHAHDQDPLRKQAARERLPGELEAVLSLTATAPPTGQLAKIADELTARAAALIGAPTTPDSPAAQALVNLLLRLAGGPPDRGGKR
jgi:energy-coupling factor transporter ATP-binding protein EcfA2